MPPAPQLKDPRREQLRRQAIQRRQAALDRIAGTRTLAIGGVIAVSCVLAGYLDASARPHRTSAAGVASTAKGFGSAYGNSSGGASSQGVFGGGSPPAASSGGGGTVISGGS